MSPRNVQKLLCRSRFAMALAPLAAFALLLVSVPGAGSAESASEPVTRIEESWQLVLNEPADSLHAPQLTTVMAPSNNLQEFYAQVNWNYRDQPAFEAGGLQISGSVGEAVVRLRSFDLGALSTDAETVSWTQAMTLSGPYLVFSVEDGMSSTWGAFGGGPMAIHVNPPASGLAGYTPDLSVNESCVTYGSNRVDMLVMTEIRYYGASGLLYTDSTPRVVFELQDD